MTIDRNITHWEGEDADGRKCCVDGHRAPEASERCVDCDHEQLAECHIWHESAGRVSTCWMKQHDFVPADPDTFVPIRRQPESPAPEPPEGRAILTPGRHQDPQPEPEATPEMEAAAQKFVAPAETPSCEKPGLSEQPAAEAGSKQVELQKRYIGAANEDRRDMLDALARLREALVKYGRHLDDCACYVASETYRSLEDCTCGLADALEGRDG